MSNNRTFYLNKEPDNREFLKLMVFLVTLMSPTFFMYLSTGNLLLHFFFLFPMGFLYLFFPFELPNFLLGWIVYIWLMVVGVRSRRPRMFLYMYSLFVILMLINLKGCSVLLEDSGNTSW